MPKPTDKRASDSESKQNQPASDVDPAWLDELRRRARLLDEGKLNMVPADEAIQRARERLAHLHK